jgi:hypothetical protein
MPIYVQAIAKSFDFTQKPGILADITISIHSFSLKKKRRNRQDYAALTLTEESQRNKKNI